MLLCSNNIKHYYLFHSFARKVSYQVPLLQQQLYYWDINTEHIKIPSKATMTYAMRNGTKNIFLEMMVPFFWSHHIIPWTDCDCFLICMPTKRFIKYPFSLSKFTHFLARQWDGPLWIIKICCDLKKILMIITATIGFPGSGGGVKYKFSAGFRKLYSKFSIVIVKIDWVSTYQQKTLI